MKLLLTSRSPWPETLQSIVVISHYCGNSQTPHWRMMVLLWPITLLPGGYSYSYLGSDWASIWGYAGGLWFDVCMLVWIWEHMSRPAMGSQGEPGRREDLWVGLLDLKVKGADIGGLTPPFPPQMEDLKGLSTQNSNLYCKRRDSF